MANKSTYTGKLSLNPCVHRLDSRYMWTSYVSAVSVGGHVLAAKHKRVKHGWHTSFISWKIGTKVMLVVIVYTCKHDS